MASFFGQLGPFDPDTDKFCEYEERLTFFFEANNVIDGKKKAILLSSIGQKQFRLIKDLVAPATLAEKAYDDIITALKRHHQPEPPHFLQRAIFEKRDRKLNESVQDYIAELRKLAEFCKFGAQLEERLCEKFTRGINNTDVQKKLIVIKDLKLQKPV